MTQLSEISNKWYELGLGLGLLPDDLQLLLCGNKPDIVKLVSVINIWEEKGKHVTWSSVLGVVSGPLIDNKVLRIKIEKFLASGKYIEYTKCHHH